MIDVHILAFLYAVNHSKLLTDYHKTKSQYERFFQLSSNVIVGLLITRSTENIYFNSKILVKLSGHEGMY